MTNYLGDQRTGVRGRPSVAAERRAQIVDAFIELVAVQGSAAVSLGDVARRAGVARTAVRHFVGNRVDLIELAVVELVDRYRQMVDEAVGPEPQPEELVAMLFDDDWVRDRPLEDRVFDLLVVEARDNAEMRTLVGGAFAHLVDALSAALARRSPSSTARELDDAAYAIVCLSEHNVILQAMGFDPARSRAAANYAQGIVESALTSSPKHGVQS